jgi:uncharacterized protein with GYD domain
LRRATGRDGVWKALLPAPHRKETPCQPTFTSSISPNKNVKDTVKRSEAFKASAKKHGCTIKEIFWVHGHYDAVSIIEAPDDTSATALSMSAAKLGFIRTQTLRAFSAAEIAKVLEKVE